MPERRTFGPVVLAGLGSAALLAWAGGRAWVDGDAGASATPAVAPASGEVGASSPLATALALVVLACWGVVLVTRGRLRRGVAVLGLLAALGGAATVVAAPFTLPDHLREQVRRDTGTVLGSTSLTGWYWVALVAAVVVLAATLAAVVLAPGWPEMSSRYDAPAAAASSSEGSAGRDDPGPTDNVDIWKALDEGRDPTA